MRNLVTTVVTVIALCSLISTGVINNAHADVAIEPVGESAATPPLSNTWVWANDALLKRVSLTDFENNKIIGTVDGGWMITSPLFPHGNNREFYVPETHYSRGSRGERTDVVTFYDTKNLKASGEVIIPPKRALNALPTGNAAISDDDRFIAVFNMVPAQSISIVDTQKRKFITEIATPGCGLVYGAGPHRFMMMCGNGALMFVTLKDDGNLQNITRAENQFDPIKDPVMEKGVRAGNVWHFVSFAGYLYSIDISKPSPVFEKPWPLISADEQKDKWRVGGRQLLAVHHATNRLYVLLHQGEVDTHKEGGTHVWLFDLKTQAKLKEVKLLSPGLTFTAHPLDFGGEWIWPFNQLYNLITSLSMHEVHARPDLIAVTQDAKPTFLLSGESTGSVAVYDALTMEFRHRVSTSNIINMTLLPTAWHEDQGGITQP